MRAGRITVSTRKFRLEDVPVPTPGIGQVRIEVKAAGVCLSDVHFLHGIISPRYLQGDEVTLGHEVSGIIESLGDGVIGWNVGARVIICAGVRDSKNRVTTLGFDYDGGFAEFIVANVDSLVRIPNNLPFEQACIIPDAVSTPWAAITQTAAVQKGQSAAVFGVGGLGVHAVQLLKIIGATPVIAVDPLPAARSRAMALGADYAFDPFGDTFVEEIKNTIVGRGLNVAFDFVGSGSVRTQALRLLSEGGKLIIIGLANEPIVIPNDIAFAYRRTQILGHYGSEPLHTKELVDLVAEGVLDLSASVSEIVPLENIVDALHRLENKIDNPIRIVITP